MPNGLVYPGAEHLDEEYVASDDAKAQVDPSEDVERLMQLGLGRDSVLVDRGQERVGSR